MIRDLITESQADGLTAQRACEVIGLSPRTWQRWQGSAVSHPSTPDATVAPVLTLPVVLRPRPYNALTLSEAAAVVALIQSPQHADASCRELALALQNGPFPTYVSHVTVWEYQRALNCNGPRGRQVAQGQPRTAPDTDWVNSPNQLWDWDITYLHTLERGVFLYLYSLLDHWSRKNIAWLIGPQLSSALVQTLWDHGLINEGLLDQPAVTWPKSLSDRGAQMRSRSTATYFKKLGFDLSSAEGHRATLQPTAHSQRQSLHRSALCDHQDSAGLPRCLCRLACRRRILQPILSVVQRRASAHAA